MVAKSQFDEKTRDLLDDKDPDMINTLLDGMRMRQEAADHEDLAKGLKEKANLLLAPIMTALEFDKVKVEGIGAVTFLQNLTNKSVSREGMEKYLIEHGVSPTLIKEAREAATTSRTQEYQIRFKA